MGPSGTIFYGQVFNDGKTGAASWLEVTRVNNTISQVVFPNGNVGIGTAEPNALLELKALQSGFSSTKHLLIYNSNETNGDYAGILFGTRSVTGNRGKGWFGFLRTGDNGVGDFVWLNDGAVDDGGIATTDEKMRLTSTGNVGIGTTSPAATFTVKGGNDTGPSIYLTTAANGSVLDVRGKATVSDSLSSIFVAGNGTASILLTDEISNVALCYSGAELSANDLRSLGDCTAGGADYAELYPVEAGIDYGEIVSLGTNLIDTYATAKDGKVSTTTIEGRVAELQRSSKPYQANVLGITSFNYSDFTSAGRNLPEGVNALPVALSGRVPVKVNLEGGAIKIGDRITSSSQAGIGMKATASGQTVGIALEPYDGTQNFGTSTLKILVFVNLGYSKLDSEVTQNEGGWIVDQASGRVKSSYTLEVPAIFASSGLWSIDENGKLIVQEIETQKLTTQQFCVGATCITETEFHALLQNAGLIPAVSTSSPQAASTPTDTEPPVITILGNNPATIEVGASYADMGVTVTDNVDSNLGYTASLDGGPELSQGAGLTIDTSATSTHSIIYKAVDQAGNTATASRTVEVITAP